MQPTTNAPAFTHDPRLDLVLDRVVDVRPELVWKAWTTPDILKKWFTPHPWQTTDCEIDLRPGGIFRTTMRSPDGVDYPSAGCYLEVVENRRLTWTSSLGPGFRPHHAAGAKECDTFACTVILMLEPQGAGTRYTAIAMHADEAACQKHLAMGFHTGWGTCLDQLVALIKSQGGQL